MSYKNAKGGLVAASFEALPKLRTPKRNRFLVFFSTFSGNLRSVDVLRRLYEILCKVFLNKLRKYGGASSFKLVKTIILDSKLISSLIDSHPSFSIN